MCGGGQVTAASISAGDVPGAAHGHAAGAEAAEAELPNTSAAWKKGTPSQRCCAAIYDSILAALKLGRLDIDNSRSSVRQALVISNADGDDARTWFLGTFQAYRWLAIKADGGAIVAPPGAIL